MAKFTEAQLIRKIATITSNRENHPHRNIPSFQEGYDKLLANLNGQLNKIQSKG